MHARGWISWSQLPFKINHSSLRQLNPLQNDRLIDALGGNDRQFHTKQGEIVLHVIFLSQQNTPCPRLIKIWYCAHCHESHFRSTSYLKWTSSSKCRLWVFAFWKIDLKAKRTMSCLPHNHIYISTVSYFFFLPSFSGLQSIFELCLFFTKQHVPQGVVEYKQGILFILGNLDFMGKYVHVAFGFHFVSI